MEAGFKERMQARSILYSFFSRAYREEADTKFIEELRSVCAPDDELLGPFAEALHADDIEKLRLDLAADYARCLLGMHADPVPPFESVWVSDLHLMMQESRDEVVELYASEGMGKARAFRIPEDHIAVELEFMSLLCKRAGELFAANDAIVLQANIVKQRTFMRNHMLTWIPDFCQKLSLRSTTAFYRALANATEAFVKADAEQLEDL